MKVGSKPRKRRGWKVSLSLHGTSIFSVPGVAKRQLKNQRTFHLIFVNDDISLGRYVDTIQEFTDILVADLAGLVNSGSTCGHLPTNN